MARTEHNGEDFHYVVGYKQIGVDRDTEVVEQIVDWRSNELIVEDQPTYAKYEVYVKAVNSKGSAPENLLMVKIGSSGQGGTINQ